MNSGINRDEWLKALGESEQPVHQDAVTTAEFAALLGVSLCTAQRKLRRLLDEGKATSVYKLVARNQGRNGSVKVPAYRLVKAKR